jgi:DoxX-like family
VRRKPFPVANSKPETQSKGPQQRRTVVTKGADGELTRREKIIYRTATGIVCAVMVFSIINFIFNDHFPFPNGPEGAFVHLGLPEYFKVELTIAKILGVLALAIPTIPSKIKEFAYFGFAITLISASIAHFARGDAALSVLFVVDPLVFLVILTISYFYFEKSRGFAVAAES